jgi:hypothetical protein
MTDRYESNPLYPHHLWDRVERRWIRKKWAVRIQRPHAWWSWTERERQSWLQWRDEEERRLNDA